jgi:nucleoside-diphosphate-sugar epimerase
MKTKVAIVGATGVLGRNLIHSFQREGRAVRALAQVPEKVNGLLLDDSEALPCDLLSIPGSLLTEYLKGCDVVIHAATALPSHPYEKRHLEWGLNNRLRMEGTSKLIGAAVRAGVELYIQQSMIRAYIDGQDRWLDENTPFDLSSHRLIETLAVADMERRVREINPKAIRWVILRGGTLIGPGTSQDQLLERIQNGQEVIAGDGSQYFSPVHVADLASAFVKVTKIKPSRGVFNISDRPLLYSQYVDELAKWRKVACPQRDLSLPKPISHRCCNEAAVSELGWFSKHYLLPESEAVSA